MMFYGTKEDIDEALQKIILRLNDGGNFFSLKEHIPANPKTTLPLYTYFVDVPSVLSAKELRSDEKQVITQEVKIGIWFIFLH